MSRVFLKKYFTYPNSPLKIKWINHHREPDDIKTIVEILNPKNEKGKVTKAHATYVLYGSGTHLKYYDEVTNEFEKLIRSRFEIEDMQNAIDKVRYAIPGEKKLYTK